MEAEGGNLGHHVEEGDAAVVPVLEPAKEGGIQVVMEPAEEDANMESIIDPDPPAEKEDLPTLLGHKYVNML